ncbi:MAG: ChbG/HpnK family deacetylase [Lachnospiraceae bacterium]|nr:ChbG/HpnK family deacetylase [Lachnospiraceae bacterium]
MSGKIRIDIHADDYALSINTSREMLELMKKGILDSISIVPNTSAYGECIEMLKDEFPSLPFLPMLSVHINLVEGLSLSKGREGKRALTETGWGGLFLASYNPFKRSKVKASVKKEMTEQVKKVGATVEQLLAIAKEKGIPCAQKKLRIDSHQHSHHIPIVREALFELIEESGLEVEYIRNSKEPLLPFLREGSLLRSYRPVNIIKNMILNLYSGAIDRNDQKNGRAHMYLWGLVMSGRMDKERIMKLFPGMVKRAEHDGRTLEILFHPGRMSREELTDETDRDAADSFYLTADRNAEYEGAICARALKEKYNSIPFTGHFEYL